MNTKSESPNKKLRAIFAKCFAVIISAVVAYFLSVILQSITGSALCIPRKWAVTVNYLVALLSGTTTLLASSGWSALENKLPVLKIKPVRPLFALGFLLVALVTANHIRSMRTECIHALTVSTDWWYQQFPSLPPSKTEVRDAKAQDFLPDILSWEQNTLFLPTEFDQAMSNYLAQVGGGRLRDGLQVVVDRAPMEMIDWAKGAGTPYVIAAQRQFYFEHFLTILCIAAGFGLVEKHFRIEALLTLFSK